MRKVNWNDIQETEGFDNPAPGAYIATICKVTDNEEKEYLRIEWDFAEGNYKGNNQDTFDRAGFWPITLIRSYKEKALGFFKAFKTALEDSNPGYTFREDDLNGMVGRKIGVVLGEEEYTSRDGDVKTRLYVYQTRSLDAIRKGDFKVPELKRLTNKPAAPAAWPSGGNYGSFAELPDKGNLPF